MGCYHAGLKLHYHTVEYIMILDCLIISANFLQLNIAYELLTCSI